MEQRLGGHADEHETSLLLAIAPERVAMSNARTYYGNALEEPATVFVSPVQFRNDPAAGIHDTETGVRGDPTLATIEKSRLILADAIAELVATLQPQCP